MLLERLAWLGAISRLLGTMGVVLAVPVTAFIGGAFGRRAWVGLVAAAAVSAIFVPFFWWTRPGIPALFAALAAAGSAAGWALRQGMLRAAVLTGLWCVAGVELFYVYTVAERTIFPAALVGTTLTLGAVTVFAIPLRRTPPSDL